MGALGMAIAEHLARDHAASLVLLGRSPMTADIQARLEGLSAAGGDAIYMQADVSERAHVETVFTELERRELQLDGIIHAAGLIEDAFVLRKRPESLDRVLAPKVAGALNLDAASTDHPLGLFVLFSSIASLMPNQGQCDYAAANAFLDHFAEQRELLREAGRRRGVTLAINWPLWAEGGITVAPEEREHLWTVFGMRPMATAVGVELFARLMRDSGPLPHFAPIEGDRDKIEEHLRIATSAVVEADATSNSSVTARIDRLLTELVDGESTSARGHGHRAPTLSELGLDSLGMIRFADRLSSELGLEIKPSIFFEYATVPSLAAHLAQRKPALSGPRAVALIDGRRANADGAAGFRKRLHNEVFFMRDHVVDGQFNVPGACFIELAVQAAALEHGRLPRRAINNLWIEKLSSADAPIEIEISLVGVEPALGYEISRTRAGRRTIHAVGELEFGEVGDDGLEALDLASIRERCRDRRAPHEVYPQIIDEGLHIGPSIMPLVELHLGTGEALARLELPAPLANTAPDYTLHPTILTGVLQTALLLNKPHGSDGSQYIPVAIDVIEFDGPLPNQCYVHCRPQAGSDGVRKFEAAIARLDGRVVARAAGISLRQIRKADRATVAVPPPASNADQPRLELQAQAESVVLEIVAEAVGLDPSEVEATQDFETYGISSIMIVDLNRRLEQRFGRLSKTLFFEYRNVSELAAYFVEAHGACVAELGARAAPPFVIPSPALPVAPVDAAPGAAAAAAAAKPSAERRTENRTRSGVEPIDDGVAIIGLAGRYPGADDLGEFWRALEEGRDCITQIPPDRFEYERWFDPDPDAEKIYARWGGFIRGVDEFDPRLFNITPRDAGLIDPQQRLFLEVVWEALEDAGHTPTSLTARSRRIGVFVGALWQPYVNLGIERTEHGQAIAPSGLLYNIPNRVSYFFDWTGPSLVIDTACSGSLTALHYAVSSLLRGEVDGAVVGGANLSLSSSKYLFLCQNRFLSRDGRCRSFGEGGDGYVPGEGIGAVLLKRLADARADGDRIDAIIRSTSVNHGGRTSGYTVPNPNQQAELITEALAAAQLDPGAVSYVEAHGTGTSLGDPIELAGLAKAFERSATGARAERVCAIGSVKSNIGHLEAAAGIAGLTKIVLQLRHGVLVPSLHAERLNPNLEIERTPFRVQRRREVWVRPRATLGERAHELPRVALLSSFGAGGSNAHAVVSEPEAADSAATVPAEFPAGLARVFVLSAREREQLHRQARRLADALARQTADSRYSLAQIASTLQTGRAALKQRAAVVVDDFDALIVSLRALGSGDAREDVLVGVEGTMSIFDADLLQQMAGRWLARGQVRELARAWVDGLDVDWRSLARERPKPVSLPTYPFERLRCWLPALPADIPASPRTLHPLIHENVSSVDRCAFRSQLSSAEFIFADHHIRGRAVLPAVVQLEMVRHAVELAGARAGSFRQVLLIRPITAEGPICEIEVGLERAGAELSFELSSGTGEDRIVYTAGRIVADAGEPGPDIDAAALEARYGRSVSGERFYASLRERDVDLGPGLRNIQEVWRADQSALARISTPAGMSLVRAAWTQRDAVLQLAGMLSPEGGSFIPFEIARVELFGPAVANGWVHVTLEKETARSRRFAGVITDHSGRIATRVLGIVTRDASVSLDGDRAPASKTRPVATIADDHPRQVVYAVPTWIDRPHGSADHEASVARLLTCGLGSRVDLRARLGAVELLPASWEQELSTSADRLDMFDDLTRAALAAVEDQLRRELEASAAARRGLVVALADGLAPVAGALAALLRNVTLEHPSLRGKVVLLAPEALEAALVGRLEAELTELDALEVRLVGATGRLVRGWDERVPRSAPTPVLRAGGRYWITGGLGGLGRLIARHAAERQPGVRLLLSGRREPRPEDRAFLHELGKLGAEVEYLRADVRELVACEAAVARARARFGGLDGIVHAAGVVRDGFFATRDRQAAQDVLAPKLRGVVNLERATQAEALEFLVLFGSLAAVAGNPGQSDYAAANAFMAGFAAQRDRLELAGLRSGRCVTVHWPLWIDGGMTMSEVASASLEARTGFGPMPAELAARGKTPHDPEHALGARSLCPETL